MYTIIDSSAKATTNVYVIKDAIVRSVTNIYSIIAGKVELVWTAVKEAVSGVFGSGLWNSQELWNNDDIWKNEP